MTYDITQQAAGDDRVGVSNGQQSDICTRFPFESIPKRIFLDTSVINAIVKYPEEIFEQQSIALDIHPTLAGDIEALRDIFFIGMRANWDIVASQKTLDELASTTDDFLRVRLMSYALEIDLTATSMKRMTSVARDFARRLIDTHFVAALPGRADRELIGNAIGYGCDVFCTRDRATIVKKRARLQHLGLKVMTPEEWWAHTPRPWAALWC